MKFAMIALAGSVAVGLVPATAAASPVASRTLIANRLYDAGTLPTTTCREKPVKRFDTKSAKSYLNGVLACLNRTWGAHLAKADLRRSYPKVGYATEPPAKFCGVKWSKDWDAYYCDASRTMRIVLSRDLLEDPQDLYLFNLMATYYGEHVQNVAGIYRAFIKLPSRNKAEFAEQNRRYNLQGHCFAGAFIRSVWKSLHRDGEDWDDLLFYLRGWAGKNGGSRKSITYWTERGFATADPGSCNTWAAPSSKVR